MSLVNAVHELIEVAAGRKNLSAAAADELHAAIDIEQAAAAPEPIAENSSPQTAEVNAEKPELPEGAIWAN